MGYVNNQRVLVEFDSSTTTFAVVGPVPGYLLMMGSISAIDAPNRVLYAFLNDGSTAAQMAPGLLRPPHTLVASRGTLRQPRGNLPPMDLVGISMATGQVITHPRACDQFPECPWSLEHL